MAVTPHLEAHHLYRFYHVGDDETLALRGVSLSVLPGEIVAIVGPSGSGKSTLVNCLAGLDEPSGGRVAVAGMRLTRRSEAERARIRARHIAVLLQSGNLFEHLSVAENLRVAMCLAGGYQPRVAGHLLDEMGLSARARALPGELSGGELARAGLAVALVNNPTVLLADEPTGEVDTATETRLLALFKSRAAAGGSILVVTHSQAVAAMADRVIRLVDGQIEHA